MAPEQRSNPLAVDHRADIYSLGVVFYEMLTGNLPVGRFPPPSERVQVDVRLDEVVLRTLEQEPARRYQHANDVKSGVEQIKSPAPPAPAPTPTPTPPSRESTAAPPRKPAFRRPLVTLGIVLAIGLALTVGLRLGRSRIVIRETPPNFGHFFGGSRFADYAVQAPINHRFTIWTEWLRDGRPVELPGLEIRHAFTPARGRAFRGHIDLVLESKPPLQPGGKPTLIRSWGLRGGEAFASAQHVAEDPFDGLSVTDSSYGHRPLHRPRAGQDYTLLVVRGDRDRLEGHAWDPAIAGRADLEMRLKVRIEPVPDAELRESPQSSSIAGPSQGARH
jgi:hypothetical protein